MRREGEQQEISPYMKIYFLNNYFLFESNLKIQSHILGL